MTAAATPFSASIADDEGTDDLVEASRGIALLCAPSVILHGSLAGLPTVEARILRGGVLRSAKVILVDIFALLNQTRTRLVDFSNVAGLTVDQMLVVSRVLDDLRSAGVRTTVEVSGHANPEYLRGFDAVRVSIAPDLRSHDIPRSETLAAAHEIRALIRSEGDLTTLASILETAIVRTSQCTVSLDLIVASYPEEERALYELAKTAAFKNGWRLSPRAPQPRRSF